MRKKTLVFILGNLTAFGPFVTDFYLPCLLELASYFSASTSVIQTSLTAGMSGLAVGQLLIGPMTDKYGRKRPLLCCLLLFVLATIGCMVSTDIILFVCFRMLQGLTGAGGLVISKVIISDSFPAADLARYFAILAAIQGAAPIIAPVAGGVAFSLSSWQGVFGVLSLWAVGLLWSCRRLSETLNEKDRLKLPVWKTFRCYATVMKNKQYLVMNLLQGFASAALMAYISASPFIFQNHFGLSPLEFSLCFACNAIGLVAGSIVVIRIRELKTMAIWSTMGLMVMAIFFSLALLFEFPFWLFEIPLFFMLICVGLLTPVSITLALNTVTWNRGMAAALLGATPFLLGGIAAPLTGIGNIIHSTVLTVMVCSFICVCLLILSVNRNVKLADINKNDLNF